MENIAFERGFNPCKRPIFFQDEGGEIANCKTYIKNVLEALSRNTPIADLRHYERQGRPDRQKKIATLIFLCC